VAPGVLGLLQVRFCLRYGFASASEVWCRYRCGFATGVVSVQVWCRYRCGFATGVVSLQVWCGKRCGIATRLVWLKVWCGERCGVAGRGVVWREEVWCGGKRCGVAGRGVVWREEVWCGKRCGVASGAVVTRGVVWCGGMSGRGWPVHSLDRRMFAFFVIGTGWRRFLLFFLDGGGQIGQSGVFYLFFAIWRGSRRFGDGFCVVWCCWRWWEIGGGGDVSSMFVWCVVLRGRGTYQLHSIGYVWFVYFLIPAPSH